MRRSRSLAYCTLFTLLGFTTAAQNKARFMFVQYRSITNPETGEWITPFKLDGPTRFDYSDSKYPEWTYMYGTQNIKAHYTPVSSSALQHEPEEILGCKKLGVYEDKENRPGNYDVVYLSSIHGTIFIKTFYPSGRLFNCHYHGKSKTNPFATLRLKHYAQDTVIMNAKPVMKKARPVSKN